MNKPSIFFLFSFIYFQTTAQTLIPYLKLNGKIIFVDSATMKPATEKEYTGVYPFSEGFSRVQLTSNGKYAYVDKTGKEITEFKYDFGYPFIEGLAQVALGDLDGFIDKTGKEIGLKYENAGLFNEGMAKVVLNKKCGFIDKTGKEVIPLQYDDAGYFREGRA